MAIDEASVKRRNCLTKKYKHRILIFIRVERTELYQENELPQKTRRNNICAIYNHNLFEENLLETFLFQFLPTLRIFYIFSPGRFLLCRLCEEPRLAQHMEVFECALTIMFMQQFASVQCARTSDHTRDLSDGYRTCRWINTMTGTLSQQNMAIWVYRQREK